MDLSLIKLTYYVILFQDLLIIIPAIILEPGIFTFVLVMLHLNSNLNKNVKNN
jgi:hypothetical protein